MDFEYGTFQHGCGSRSDKIQEWTLYCTRISFNGGSSEIPNSVLKSQSPPTPAPHPLPPPILGVSGLEWPHQSPLQSIGRQLCGVDYLIYSSHHATSPQWNDRSEFVLLHICNTVPVRYTLQSPLFQELKWRYLIVKNKGWGRKYALAIVLKCVR